VDFVPGISSGIASADGGLLPIDSNNPFWDDSDQQFDTDNLFASNGSLSFGSSSFGFLSLPDALSLPGPGAAVVPPPAPPIGRNQSAQRRREERQSRRPQQDIALPSAAALPSDGFGLSIGPSLSLLGAPSLPAMDLATQAAIPAPPISRNNESAQRRREERQTRRAIAATAASAAPPVTPVEAGLCPVAAPSLQRQDSERTWIELARGLSGSREPDSAIAPCRVCQQSDRILGSDSTNKMYCIECERNGRHQPIESDYVWQCRVKQARGLIPYQLNLCDGCYNKCKDDAGTQTPPMLYWQAPRTDGADSHKRKLPLRYFSRAVHQPPTEPWVACRECKQECHKICVGYDSSIYRQCNLDVPMLCPNPACGAHRKAAPREEVRRQATDLDSCPLSDFLERQVRGIVCLDAWPVV
jgi:hypothetical protein